MEHHDRSPEPLQPNRRRFLLTTVSTVAGGAIAAYMPSGMSGQLINEFTSQQPYQKESKMKGTKPSIVFCHGIWADGSCFSKVMPALQAEGHQCIAAQYSLNTTADDIATVKRALGRVSSPADKNFVNETCSARRSVPDKKSISDWKNIYLDQCHTCVAQNECGGFFQWATKLHSAHIRPLTGIQQS